MLFRQIKDPQQRRIIIAQVRATTKLSDENPNNPE